MNRMHGETAVESAAAVETTGGQGSSGYGAALEDYAGPISALALMADAERATGLSGWGGRRWDEERFRHDFTTLCDAIEATGDVSARGRGRTRSRLHTMLVSRLRYLDAREALPAADAQSIVAPLIGTGLPRAGTTFLHGLLAQDPANRVARAFEAAMPAPLPGPDGDERASLYRDILEYQGMTGPGLTQIHPFGAELPEECIFVQEGDCGGLYGVYWNVPAYQQVIADKADSAFRWQVGVMQYLQANRPGGRWALKAPGHMFAWEAMRMAFPDALIYVNHRDPGKVAPSIASLFMALRGLFSDSGSDPAAVGQGLLEGWSYAADRYVDWRVGEGKDANVVDIHFVDLIANPIDTVATLYDRFGIEFTGAARDAMLRHLDTDQHGKHASRVYTLAEFGMSEAAVDSAFGRYMDHFGIRREKRA